MLIRRRPDYLGGDDRIFSDGVLVGPREVHIEPGLLPGLAEKRHLAHELINNRLGALNSAVNRFFKKRKEVLGIQMGIPMEYVHGDFLLEGSAAPELNKRLLRRKLPFVLLIRDGTANLQSLGKEGAEALSASGMDFIFRGFVSEGRLDAAIKDETRIGELAFEENYAVFERFRDDSTNKKMGLYLRMLQGMD